MRLLSIRLENVRRFAAPVEVTGIGPGLNLLAAPNESGKSTIFDALEALFLAPHRSRAKDIAALQPHSGGAPEIRVGVETAEGSFEVAKRWLGRPMAEVRRGGALVAQADAAEDWLRALLGADRDPAGLLWVRQGRTEIDPKDEAARAFRRDLLSSVAGEVEAMTGGRRMDRARDRVRAELDAYATETGRPKAGGRWKAALDEAALLETEAARLREAGDRLRGALDRRRAVRRERAELSDPEAETARRAALDAAREGVAAAERHEGLAAAARREEEMARIAHEAARGRRTRLLAALAEIREAEAAARSAAEALDAKAQTAEAAREAARAADEAAEVRLRAAGRALARAHRAMSAGAERRRRAEAKARIREAEAARGALEAAAAEARAHPSEAIMRRIEAAAQEAAGLRAARERDAPSVSVAYLPGAEGRATIAGAPLPEGERRPLPEGGALDLEGIGRLTIRPGRAVDDAEARETEARLAAALGEAGAETVEAAREAAARRAAAERRRDEAKGRLGAVAPDGLDALRAALAALPEPAPDDPEAPTPAAAQAEEEAAAAMREAAARRLAEAAAETAAADRALIAARAAREAAAARLSRARVARDALEEADEATLSAAIESAARAEAAAGADRARLEAEAPDIAAARAELSRAEGAAANAAADRTRLAGEEARLDATIDHIADDAVEERLAATETRLEAARERAARIDFEVRALRRLAAALDAARDAARDRWLAPVSAEIRPLLRLIWPEAELRMDAAAALPEALLRDGPPEALEILSGGTKEQIAILVRLAFARMLAAAGRPAPVILDDALVHSDDDRIERMFRALHRQAAEQQILVLSCRQRAFRELGARSLAIAPAGAEHAADAETRP